MKLESIMDLYCAGEVRRYHTMRLLHPQSDAEHSWGVALIILWLYADAVPSGNLLRAALLHDVPETETGDPPAQVKWDNPRMKEQYDRLETAFFEKHRMSGFNLTARESQLLYFADIAELVMFASVEMSMGNARMATVRERGLNRMGIMCGIPDFPRAIQLYDLLRYGDTNGSK